MADKKISELDALSGADTADGDALIIADISAGLTKKLTFGELKNALDTGGTGFVRVTGDTMTGDLALSGADVTFGTNGKAIFGAGSDLSIYHDGSNSHIQDNGTGNLVINGTEVRILSDDTSEYSGRFITDGAVELSFNGDKKFETTNTGIDVTGTVTADGLILPGSSDAFGSTASNAYILRTGSLGTAPFTQAGALLYQPRTSTTDGRSNHLFYTGDPLTQRMNIHSNGDISFYASDGTTQAFHWDAADESLGIGDTTPESPITVKKDVTDASIVKAYSSASNSRVSYQIGNDADNWFMGIDGGNSDAFFIADVVSSSDRLVITQAGNVNITGGNLDVTGTVTADGLTVDGAAAINGANLSLDNAYYLSFRNAANTSDITTLTFDANDQVVIDPNQYGTVIGTSANPSLKVAGNRDISFYEDTGTTAKFFWDASAESLGIGTSSPSLPLHVNATTSGLPVTSGTTQTNGVFRLSSSATSGIIDFGMNGTNPWIQSTGSDGLGATYNLLLNPNGGNVGIGTTSPDNRFHVVAGAEGEVAQFTGEIEARGLSIRVETNTDASALSILNAQSGGAKGTMAFETDGAERMRIAAAGGIKIPNQNATNEITFTGTDFTNVLSASTGGFQLGTTGAGYLSFLTSNSEAIHIDSSGNVGIGDSSPTGNYGKNLQIHTAATSGSSLQLTDGTTGGGVNDGLQIICTNGLSYIWNRETTDMVFATSNLERMRIDASGSWMAGNTVARTASQYSNQGGASWYHPDQHFEVSTTGNRSALEVGKNNANDGELITLRKQGAVVGSIGTTGGDLIIGTGDTGLYFYDGATSVIPWKISTNAASNGYSDLGHLSYRWKDLHLSGGVVFGDAGGTGTSSSNSLDSYEEGTFTPAVTGSTTAGSATYTIQQGSYTKIGNVVYWQARLGYTGHTGAGNMRVAFPFTSANRYAAGNYSYRDGLTVPASEDLKIYIPPSATFIGLYSVALGTDAVSPLVLDTAITDLSISGVCTVI